MDENEMDVASAEAEATTDDQAADATELSTLLGITDDDVDAALDALFGTVPPCE